MFGLMYGFFPKYEEIFRREKAGSNRHTPLRQSGTLPIMLFSLLKFLTVYSVFSP
jgi:hypothetical protein